MIDRAHSIEEKSRELLLSGKLRKIDVESLKSQYENQLKYAEFLATTLRELAQNITSISRLSNVNEADSK